MEEELIVDMDPDEGHDEHPPDRHPLDKIDLTHLKGDELAKMEALLLKHHTAFSCHELDIGKCPVRAPRVRLKAGVNLQGNHLVDTTSVKWKISSNKLMSTLPSA